MSCTNLKDIISSQGMIRSCAYIHGIAEIISCVFSISCCGATTNAKVSIVCMDFTTKFLIALKRLVILYVFIISTIMFALLDCE